MYSINFLKKCEWEENFLSYSMPEKHFPFNSTSSLAMYRLLDSKFFSLGVVMTLARFIVALTA